MTKALSPKGGSEKACHDFLVNSPYKNEGFKGILVVNELIITLSSDLNKIQISMR